MGHESKIGVQLICNTGIADVSDACRRFYGQFNNIMSVLSRQSNEISAVYLTKIIIKCGVIPIAHNDNNNDNNKTSNYKMHNYWIVEPEYESLMEVNIGCGHSIGRTKIEGHDSFFQRANSLRVSDSNGNGILYCVRATLK